MNEIISLKEARHKKQLVMIDKSSEALGWYLYASGSLDKFRFYMKIAENSLVKDSSIIKDNEEIFGCYMPKSMAEEEVLFSAFKKIRKSNWHSKEIAIERIKPTKENSTLEHWEAFIEKDGHQYFIRYQLGTYLQYRFRIFGHILPLSYKKGVCSKIEFGRKTITSTSIRRN